MAVEPGSSEETLADILGRYEQKGFTGAFSARAGGMVFCHECRDESPADQVPLEGLHRLEGVSDPSEEAVAAALECPACGAWGTIVLSYGPGASAEDAGVLANLLDDRGHSVLERGR